MNKSIKQIFDELQKLPIKLMPTADKWQSWSNINMFKASRKFDFIHSSNVYDNQLSISSGISYFYDLPIIQFSGALMPRNDSEEIINILQSKIDKTSTSILDIGCGTGCLSVAIAKAFPTIKLFKLVDINLHCLLNAIVNFTLHKIEAQSYFIRLDMMNKTMEHILQKSDILISNPPYIKTLDIKNKTENQQALDGGVDGYKFLERLAYIITKKRPKLSILEIGYSEHAKRLQENLKEFHCQVFKDMIEEDRFVVIRPK